MIVIGLGHKARHGKDYTAKVMMLHAAKRYRRIAQQYGFANALKSHCRVAFGMREKDAPLLQMVGTDLYRRQEPDIWVRVLIDTLKEQQPDIAIVTDVRFPNEVAALKQLGGSLVKVSRLQWNGEPWIASDRDPNHPSETALDLYNEWDEYIECVDGELGLLEYRAQVTFDRIYKEACGG